MANKNEEVEGLYNLLTAMTNKTVVSLDKKHDTFKNVTKLELLQELSNAYDEIANEKCSIGNR